MEDNLLSQGYGIMPNAVLYDSKISSSAKLLFCVISSLCGGDGYCWAGNEHFALKLGITERQVQRCLSQLEAYLSIEQGDSHKRKIYLDKNVIPPRQKCHTTTTKMSPPIIGVNNTNIIIQDDVVRVGPSLKFSDEEMNSFHAKFPFIDVLEEREKAVLWLEASGKKYKNYGAFFRLWLGRCRPPLNKLLPKNDDPKEWITFEPT